MRRDRQIAILRVVLLLVLISIPVLSEMGLFSGRMRINDAFHEGSNWLKLDEIPARSFLSASGATNQYMYFVYEENNATDVDIFDIAGTYQCTFCFSDLMFHLRKFAGVGGVGGDNFLRYSQIHGGGNDLIDIPHRLCGQPLRLLLGFDSFHSAFGQKLAVELLQIHRGQFLQRDIADVRLDVVIDVAFIGLVT